MGAWLQGIGSDPKSGSNDWISGFTETVANPVDRAMNPGDTVAGAFDAAALNFDEGVGGLSSLIDTKPGNTAGSGTQQWELAKDFARQTDDVPGGGIADNAQEWAVETSLNIGPDWLDEASIFVGVLAAIAILSYAVGQLFDVEVGS